MNRGRSRGRWLDAAIGAQVLPRHVVAEVALRSAVLEARLRGAALSAVKVDIGHVVERPVFGLDIDHARRSQTVFSRQHSGQQADRLGEAWTQHLPEAGDALRKLDPINSVLKIGVVAAHVQLSVRILRDARRLQYHLVQRSVRALRQLLNRLLRERVFATARIRRQGVARLVQPRRRDREADRLFGLHRNYHRRSAFGRDRHDRSRPLEPIAGRHDRIGPPRDPVKRKLARVVARRMRHDLSARALDRQRRMLDRSAERVLHHPR